MGYTKDLWFAEKRRPDGTTERVKTSRHGVGKRWAACWIDPDERERSKSFTGKTAATKFWQKQESDIERGEYVGPKAGRDKLETLAQRWLSSLKADPTTERRYEEHWRLHVKPVFGDRAIKSLTRPSEVQAFLTTLGETYGSSTVGTARHVLRSVLELAVADGELKKNPARSNIINTGKRPESKIEIWPEATVWKIIDAHPASMRAMPFTIATTGMREGELYGLSEDEIDFDHETIRVKHQIKRLGRQSYAFALPKSDKERTVPLPRSTAQELRAHMEAYPPVLVTLPWERSGGELRTYRLIFTQPDTERFWYHGTVNPAWRAALEAAGLIGPPVKNPYGPGSGMRYVMGNRRDLARHQLRHWFASTQLASGTNIKELAVILGHSDPAFTLRIYAHLMPDSFDRARQAIDDRFYRPRAVSNGTGTERA